MTRPVSCICSGFGSASDFKDDDDLDKEGATEAKGYDAFARQAGDSHGELKMQKSGSFTSKKKRILVYFDVPGRAESIRLAAVIARVCFLVDLQFSFRLNPNIASLLALASFHKFVNTF